MKKIKLNESDLLKIVNKVLNEQDERQFDEDKIDLLHFIFERELKPPFSKMVMKPPVNRYGILGDGNYDCEYYNRDNEHIGWSKSTVNYFKFNFNELFGNLSDKVRQVFQLSYENWNWWYAIEPHLKSWLENQINAEVKYIGYGYG